MTKVVAILMALMMLFSVAYAEDEVMEMPFEIIQEDGKTFIEVTGNPSTGFVWTVFAIVGDVVTASDPVAVPAESDETLDGAPVQFRIEVEAVNAGETILVLRYLRPWEMNIEQELPILVNVDENGEMFFMYLEGMPLQMTAVEVMAEDHAVLMENETLGQVIALFPEEMPLPGEGENVKIWSNGVMALSFPGRINVLGWETVAPPMARLPEGPVAE